MAQAKAPAKAKNESGNDKLKLGIAIAALAIGGVLIAWNYGAFDKVLPQTKLPDASAKITPEMKKAYERQKKELEQLQKEGKAPEQAGS